MVFESIVVDVLNKFLGDYVENLNRSQLKLGIWGGDVVLENLVLKQNALEELNIPVQTVYGHLGKLTLKIPWKNLYGASVEAQVERLFLVVNPNAEVKYDKEKEERLALASKQAELARVEEAKKKEVEEDKMDETFVEKLVTQIIKNVQLTIKDIHVRYEDSITNPKQPFSLGITLHNLSVHTTDENWKQTVVTEAVTKIYKILSLEGLAIYWNSETELYARTGSDTIKGRLQSEIATKTSQPTFYSYALGPINATAKLKLNTKPEAETPKFNTPKVTLSLHMEQLSISLSKNQYRDMMLMFDSMDRMSKGMPYRKYRPDLKTYRGHYKEWWRFAYTCILEEEVRRRRNNWDWAHMLQHRQLCKNYATAYQSKLTTKGKVNADQQTVLDEAEKRLDLFNLVVIRQRIEMEVERLGKLEAEARKSRGWFGGWWSSANAKDDQLSENTDILKQFQNAMTPDEKEKLFRAIDYQENSAPLHLPVEYVAVCGEFRLDRLQVTVVDQTPVLAAAVDAVSIDFYQRPSANAIRMEIQMHTFTVSGTQQGDFVPAMVVSKEVAHDVHLLNIMFETNPLDQAADQRVKVAARPLQIVYDAQTVIRIVEVFKPPEESTALTQLQAAAGNKLSDLKEKSALGMQYAVHQHMFLDLDVDVAPSYIIIPQTGQYKNSDVQCAVVKLGAIRLKSEPRAAGGPLDVAKLYRSGLDDDRVMAEIAKHSYDKITLALTQMQIVVAKKGENWAEAIAADEKGTPLHLLQPTNLIIQIHKCLITDDPRMPKIKVRGELEKIAVSISQDRLLSLCEILVSMPLPRSEVSTQLKSSESKASSLSLLTKYLDPAEKQKRDSARTKKVQETGEPSVQLTEVEAFFIIKEVLVRVNRQQQYTGGEYDKFLEFGLTSLECTVTQKTFNLEAMVRLGAVTMSHHRVGHETVFIIDTPEGIQQIQTAAEIMSNKDSEYLITICYCNVDKKCPEFRSLYGSVEQLIELKFTKLKMHLHLQSLQEMMTLLNEYQTRLADIQSTQDRVADAGPLATIMEDTESIFATKSKTSVTKTGSKKTVESIQIKMKAKLGTVEIEFATDLRPLSLVRLQGMRAGAVVKASYTEVHFNIASLYVRDLNVKTLHNDILKVVGGDVVNVRVVMFNADVAPASDVDMSIDATLNTLRITFLNWFVTDMLDFLNNFQTAQQAIKDASAQAAEAARERAAAAYQNSTKVLLKVRMAAPIIIVPENSSSSKVLIVDLGRMNINNKFIDLKVDDSTNTVTVDELTLELEEMKVSCANIEHDRSLIGERELLRPTSFKLLVKRSLSTWHHALPDLDVSGRIQTITITVGHSDYKSIMRILNQNLTEGQEVVQKSVPVSKTVSKTTVKTQPSRVVTRSALAVVESASAKKEETLKATMKFCFTMDKFVINLSTTAASDNYDEDLARLTLSVLSLKGRMFSDGSMHTTLLLVDCTIDDARPNRGSKIVRYLGRRTKIQDDSSTSSADTALEKIRSMVDITYTQKNHDTFIDLKVFSFNLILAMDFLNKLAEFATSGLAEDPLDAAQEAPVLAPVAAELKSPEERVQHKKQVSVSLEPRPSVKEGELPAQSMMTVNIKIEQPDIILVESLEDRSCDAFVLNMECRLKLRQTSERMVAEGGVSSLQISARRLGAVLGADTQDPPWESVAAAAAHSLPNVEFVKDSTTDGPSRDKASPEKSQPRYLLAPTHVTLAVSQPPGSGMHVDITISDIKITISPDMLALLMRVLATMQRSEEDDAHNEPVTLVYRDLWGIRPVKPRAYWFLNTEEATEALAMEFENDGSPVVKPLAGEICMLRSPSIVVSFEMEVGRETVPVLVMQASLEGQLKDWSSDVSVYCARRPSWCRSRWKWGARPCPCSSCRPRSRDSSRTGAQM
ncbi:hypothetical protein O0L34_g4356 [Tuta absoluta]|nr:hypothetical protein O0L34_g4356 [Tuta absoluta]